VAATDAAWRGVVGIQTRPKNFAFLMDLGFKTYQAKFIDLK
jgi:hypothetical protein